MQLRRGFHRIGLVGLVPLGAASIALATFACYMWLTEPASDYHDRVAREVLQIAIAVLALGGLWYLLSWALGWIIAGFQND